MNQFYWLGGEDYWIGLKRSPDGYAWVDGTPTDFTNWGEDNPTGDCVLLHASHGENYKWYSTFCIPDNFYEAVCETFPYHEVVIPVM